MSLMFRARWPLLVFVVALIPRLIDLGNRPFWLDEVFTLERASLPPADLVHDAFLNHHLPSFFLMLAPLIPLGNPEFWLRIPSALFGAGAVAVVFMIARRIAGRNAGIIAALIAGLSPAGLAFSQEARSYTLEMLLILVALYGVTRLTLDLPAAALPLHRHPERAGWGAFILGSAAALDVLGDGLPWLITANIIFAVLLWMRPALRPMLLRNLLIADAVIGLCSVPFYLLMLRYQDKGFVDSVMWIPPLNLARLWYDVGSVYFMRIADSVSFRFMVVPTPGVLVWAIDAGLVAMVGAAFWRLRRHRAQLALLGVALLFLPLLFTIISIWRPILLPRYILWSAAPFAVLAGVGAAGWLDRLAPRLRNGLIGVTAALLIINMLPYYKAETKPRWDIAAKILSTEVQPGDVIYLYDTGALPILRHYLPKDTQMVVLSDSDGDLAHAAQALGHGHRVWTVYGHAGQSGGVKQKTDFADRTKVLGTPQVKQAAGRRIEITLFDPPGNGRLVATD